MCKNNAIILSLILAASSASVQSQSSNAEIMTLFSTPQERTLIDNNRFRIAPQKQAPSTVEAAAPKTQKKVLMQDVMLTIKLDGVTLTQSGDSIAWLNGKAYENAGKLEDGSRIYIKGRLNAQVQIKTPDGKYHSLVTGESSEIKYQKVVEG